MYKAFIDDKPLVIADVYREENVEHAGYEVMSDAEFDFDDVLAKLSEANTTGVFFLSASPLQAWHEFTSGYVLMEAAGGVVKKPSGEVLVIFRKKKWDLPKGKLDFGESPEDAALREVNEECGIDQLKIEKEVLKTFHTYTEKDKFILKKTHWYAMSSDDLKEPVPQSEEDIEKVKWMTKEKILDKVFSNTYQSIKDVLKAYFNLRN